MIYIMLLSLFQTGISFYGFYLKAHGATALDKIGDSRPDSYSLILNKLVTILFE